MASVRKYQRKSACLKAFFFENTCLRVFACICLFARAHQHVYLGRRGQQLGQAHLQ
ncbi:hypothetical protein ECAE60S_01166 [Eoetvoesiella caeni]